MKKIDIYDITFIEISYKQKKNGRSRIHNCSTILQLVFNIKYITFIRKMLISNDFQQQCLYLHSYLYKYKSIMSSSRYNNIG